MNNIGRYGDSSSRLAASRCCAGVRSSVLEPVALGAVADLIVILQADDEAIAGQTLRRSAVLAVAVPAVVPGVQKWLLQHLGQLLGLAVVLVVALRLAGQIGVDGVMEVVAPLAIQAVTAPLGREQQARIVEVALGDDGERAAAARGHLVGRLLHGPQDVAGAEVVDGVDRIQPQAIEVKLLQPHPHVVENVVAHRSRSPARRS